MSITVDVGLLSGKTATVKAGLDEEVGALKRRAQIALGVGGGRLVDSSGSVLDACAPIMCTRLQNGDLLALHINRIQVQACRLSFAAILGDGSVVTWGSAAHGGDSSAVQDQLKNVQQIQASDAAFAAILGDGSVVTWGSAAHGGDSSAVQDQLENVQQIQASRFAFAAVLADGSVVTWGDAAEGGDSSAVQDQLKNVQQIQASDRAFAAILGDGSVVTWGSAAHAGDSSAVQDMDGPMQLTRPRSYNSKVRLQKLTGMSKKSMLSKSVPFAQQIRVLLDVTIHEFPCIDLSLDYQDVCTSAMGNRQTDIRTGVLKQRLKKDGTPVGEVVNNVPGSKKSNPSIRNDTGNVTCGESIKQCQQDGTSKSSYQPPQIARLQSGVTAPLKLNLSLNLQNITFKPLNLKPLASLHLDDRWDDWGGDYDEDFLYERSWDLVTMVIKTVRIVLSTYTSNWEANRSARLIRERPVARNTMVNGHDIGEALMEVARCSWWTWGIEEFAATCWLRTGKRYHTKHANSHSSTQSYEYSHTSFHSFECLKSDVKAPPPADAEIEVSGPPAQPRRLSSYDDLGPDYVYGRREQKGESCRIHGHFDVNRPLLTVG
ncbi:hypothetical protein AK812_SmicGene19724 [Symbiodinium microadriaticum]|uniref:E3 ubiquitin-protein ligase HERC2 n=1 Tax=Symbiodinium microadriaticum TaxID=2951 RepID=A0A1Q9DRT9_SYMMI|nr:hypothetical protein AK812_SmicGene19724 [Symbiodinium microadriaticum]